MPRRATKAARKPRAATSYERRFSPERMAKLRAKYPGATETELHQYARGHKPKEHVERAEKQRERGQLTESQKAAIRRISNKQAERMGEDPAEVRAVFMDAWAMLGDTAPAAFRDEIKALKAMKRERGRTSIKWRGKVVRIDFQTAHTAAVIARMAAFAELWGLPDWRYLFYHN